MSTPNNDTKGLAVPKFGSFKSKAATTKSEDQKSRGNSEKTESARSESRVSPLVPSFASFKSKAQATEPEVRKSRSSSGRTEEGRGGRIKDNDRHPKRRKHRHESGNRYHEDSQVTHRPKSPERRHVRNRSESKAEKASPSASFVLDVKGDALIRKFGGLDRAKVPAYFRYGRGRVFGSEGRLLIHHDGPMDQFSIRMPGESLGGDRDGLGSKRLRISPDGIRVRKQRKKIEDEDDDYIAVRHSKRRQGGSHSESDEGPSYRSIEGKRKAGQMHDAEDSDSESDEGEGSVLPDDPLRQKSADLNRRVKEHPEDTGSWLELVDHQDTLLEAAGSLDRQAHASVVHSYDEIKVSMLESALSSASTKNRGRVLVRLMQEGCKVWTSRVAAQKWTQVIHEEQDNFDLWKTHLDFEMSNISGFQFEDIKKMLLDRLDLASRRADFDEAVFVFLRLTRYLHDSGYRELAAAAWQGFLELNFFRPHHAATSGLRDFWESEAPRIGEEGALGWRHFVENGGEAPEPRTASADELKSKYPLKAWARKEQQSDQAARLPARMMDDGAAGDPFRVVMFSDIEPLLFLIPAEGLPTVTGQIVDAFLLFCGLQPAVRSSGWTEEAQTDQFVSVTLDGLDYSPSWASNESFGEEQPIRVPPFRKTSVHASITLDLLFSRGGWYQYISAEKPEDLVEISWVLSTVRQLVLTVGMEQLAVYYLAMCFWKDSQSIKKPAKALLKRYPANIDLYVGYALCELNNGKKEVAINVLTSAKAVAQAAGMERTLEFWKAWSWIELETGGILPARRRICSVVGNGSSVLGDDGQEVPASAVLKAHQSLSSGFEDSMAGRKLDTASVQAECLVLMSYLTGENPTEPKSQTQGNISAAMSTTNTIRRAFRSRRAEKSDALERVLQLTSRLLYWNASRGPHRRVFMQECLAGFIELFPRNTVFISLFEWTDSSLRVKDETRALLTEKILRPTHDCVDSRRFAILHELSRGNGHSARAAFEKAVSSDRCRNSAVLWMAYARFCSSHPELRNGAKDVFFRGLRHCPWHKGVMMEAFRSELGTDDGEMESVYHTMTAKGLRVHNELPRAASTYY